MFRPLFALSLMAVALNACTNTPPQPPSTLIAVPNVDLANTYPLSDISTPTPSVANKRWQEFYQDDKLKALIELGLANNKNLEQASLAIQKSAAQYQISNNKVLPTVVASTNYTHSGNYLGDSITRTNGLAAGLGLANYELDMWGKISALKEQALHSYLATAAARDSLQIALIANIAQSYVNVSYAKAELILAQSTADSRERSLYIARKRFEAGIDAKSPTLQATSLLENANLAVLNAKTKLIKAQNALQLLIGSPIPAELEPEPAITNIINQSLISTGLPSELLYYRPDIAQAEYLLKASGANISVARAAFFPSISLGGNLGLASNDLSQLFSQSALSWSFAPSISLPIFDAGARRANYELSVIEQKQQLANYESVIQTAFREVNDVLANRANFDEQLASQYRLQKTYQEIYDMAFAVFRSGLSNYLEVLDAERSLFAVQQAILQLESQRVINQIELYKVLGGGASLDTPQITQSGEQIKAMIAARLATDDELATLPDERLPATLQPTKVSTNTVPTKDNLEENVIDTINPSDNQAIPKKQ